MYSKAAQYSGTEHDHLGQDVISSLIRKKKKKETERLVHVLSLRRSED